MRAFRRRGHTCGFAVSFRERDFILGPADDTCLGLTAVWKATATRPPAGPCAQISLVYPFVNYSFLLL